MRRIILLPPVSLMAVIALWLIMAPVEIGHGAKCVDVQSRL